MQSDESTTAETYEQDAKCVGDFSPAALLLALRVNSWESTAA